MGLSPRATRLFALGGAAPDLPIIAVFAAFAAASGFDIAEATARFRAAYEGEPALLAAHNLLHAPPSLALLFLASLAFRKEVSASLQAFLAGCAAHCLIDIYTHVKDGPLMLWPFDWSKRFDGPLSHWDPSHFGYVCLIAEATLILMFLASRLWSRPRRARAAAG